MHKMMRHIGLVLMVLMLPGIAVSQRYDPAVLPKGQDYFNLRDGLNNCRLKFEREKIGRIAFLGGSITESRGWRNLVIRYLEERFPEAQFEFISAGIASMGSVPHAFRLERDILAKGPVDLLFVEAAVNDTANTANADHMLRGMEGIVRHVRVANPLTDVVHLHFVMPAHMTDYSNGRTPVSIAQHERVADAYGNATLNLSLEVTERIAAGEFTWNEDFKDLHPAPFGHRLYASSIARMMERVFSGPLPAALRSHPLPELVDPLSYVRGRFASVAEVHIKSGFSLEDSWKPADDKGTRPGFVNVPALVGSKPGAEFDFEFQGTGAGLFITSGPDAGQIEFSIDSGKYQTIDTITPWSRGLHLPWALILADGLSDGPHTVRVRIAEKLDANSNRGTALRVFHLLLN